MYVFNRKILENLKKGSENTIFLISMSLMNSKVVLLHNDGTSSQIGLFRSFV